jgi:hypothetical protein
MSSRLPIGQLPTEPWLALGTARPAAPPDPGDLVDMAGQILNDELQACQSRTAPRQGF